VYACGNPRKRTSLTHSQNLFRSHPLPNNETLLLYDLCHLVVSVTLSLAQELVKLPGDFPSRLVLEWTYADWKVFRETVDDLVARFLDIQADPDKRKIYSKKRIHLNRYMELYQATSPIRKAIQELLDDYEASDGAVPKVSAEELSDFL